MTWALDAAAQTCFLHVVRQRASGYWARALTLSAQHVIAYEKEAIKGL